jgi:hypothetical protein
MYYLQNHSSKAGYKDLCRNQLPQQPHFHIFPKKISEKNFVPFEHPIRRASISALFFNPLRENRSEPELSEANWEQGGTPFFFC